MRVRKRAWEVLEIAQPGDGLSRAFDLAIRGLIALNVLTVILETVPEVEASAGVWLRWFDIFSVAVFSVEYVLRLWSSVEGPARQGPVSGRVRFALTPLLLVDLLAILPFYLPIAGVDLRILRGVRLFRLFRILKLARYSEALRTLGRVFARRRAELTLTLVMVGFLLWLASALMFFAEHGAQPGKFPSIPAAMWWGIVTLTTLGYGDVYPVTLVGRVIGGYLPWWRSSSSPCPQPSWVLPSWRSWRTRKGQGKMFEPVALTVEGLFANRMRRPPSGRSSDITNQEPEWQNPSVA